MMPVAQSASVFKGIRLQIKRKNGDPMKKLALILALVLALMVTCAFAEGTTVQADPDSATGYSVTFRYEAPDATRVRLKGNFTFTDYAHASHKTALNADPADWVDGMFNYNTSDYYCDMVKGDDGVWSVTLPLPNGTYSYNFYVGGESEDVTNVDDAEKVDDPAYPCIVTGYTEGVGSSSIYVPYDAEKQAKTINVEIEAPRTDDKVGTVFFEALTYGETTVPYGVYLPAGFDAERAEKYPVLVMLHGGGGNEGNWFNDGLANIMDNLIADGGLEDTIVVTPSWQVFGFKSTVETIETCYDMVANYLFPTISEKYNGAEDAAHRAIGGLSMGGARVMYFAYNHSDLCDYYFAYSAPWLTDAHGTPELNTADYEGKTIFIGCGQYDSVKVDAYLNPPSQWGSSEESTYKHVWTLADAGVSFVSADEPPYGHSWQTWRQLAADSIGNYLWK